MIIENDKVLVPNEEITLMTNESLTILYKLTNKGRITLGSTEPENWLPSLYEDASAHRMVFIATEYIEEKKAFRSLLPEEIEAKFNDELVSLLHIRQNMR